MNKGFTLIEVIIVLCIILLLLVIVWPIGANFFRQGLLSKAQQQVVWILKQARANAVNQKNNSSFGVFLDQGRAVVFEGDNYENRDSSADIIYNLPESVVISGLQTVNFAANTGFVINPGSIILRSGSGNKEIKINKLGVIDY